MTLQQIIYNVKNLKSGGRQSDDSLISLKQYSFIIGYYRAVLLKQDLQKGRNVNPDTIQDLGKVKIKKVDGKECNCDIKGCSLYKVETVIPKSIEVDGKPLLFVKTLNGKSFQRTTYDRVYWDQFAQYTGKLDKWFKIGEELYLSSPNHSLGKHINIQGVFEDPQAANIYKTCECDNATECYQGFDFEYPFPATMLDTLYKMMIDAELRFTSGQLNDVTNNSKDDAAASN